MIISVKAKPGSAKNEIKKISDSHYEIKVTTPPEKGKANKTIIELLSGYFKIPKSSIHIKSGETSRNKKIEITI